MQIAEQALASSPLATYKVLIANGCLPRQELACLQDGQDNSFVHLCTNRPVN